MEGQDLSAELVIWEELAVTEMRLQLMSTLIKIKVGLADVEEFNLGLRGNLRNPENKGLTLIQEKKVVTSAMEVKMRDEQITKSKLMKSREDARRELAKKFKKNSKTYRSKIRKLRAAALAKKEEYREWYNKKIEHLKFKYREDKEDKLDTIPPEMMNFASLSIFDREKYRNLEALTFDITCVGEVNLTNETEKVIKMHPKFSLMEPLKEGGSEFEQESAYAKYRIQRSKELEETLEEANTEEMQLTPEQEEYMEEQEAMSRLTFDPVEKVFDDRKLRVTDLKECSRVTLPKPLPNKEETMIEMRREIHTNIYNTYRKERCNQEGEQKPNLSPEEQEGLKTLRDRIKKKEILVMKTDKSGKMCVTTPEEYIKMGLVHAGKDKIISWRKINEMEKEINGHSIAWAKMHNSGENHGHQGRVMDSKVNRSNNRSTMYVVYKDHKSEPGKTRPIATGCSGNTRALSNSVSSFLESVANSIENKFECISSEDMLNSTKEANKIMAEYMKKWKQKRLEKLRCKTCKYKEESLTHCHLCKDDMSEDETEIMEMHYDCDACGEEWRSRMEQECKECGPGIFWEDQEVCLLGLDVVALFPSMSSVITGRIVREHVRKSQLKIEGFDWMQGGRYIVVNRKYTGDLDCLRDVLPWKRNKGSVIPGMKSKELNSKKGDIKEKWNFPKKEPTKKQIREMQARIAEIGVRFLFENFVYKFSGENYHQQAGGPIGARVTMAAARIVMSDWGEKWRNILEGAGVMIGMLDGYVDDVRNNSTCLKYGTRWNEKEKKFKITEEAKQEDLILRKEMHETSNERMGRVCLPAINSINRDLVFTKEVPEEFEENKLPTLDFSL